MNIDKIISEIEFEKAINPKNIGDKFLNLQQKQSLKIEIQNLINDINNKIIPTSYSDDLLLSFTLRHFVISNFNYSLISKEFLNELSIFLKDKKCLEIMGGTGVLSKGLKDFGVDITCTDNYSWSNFNFNNLWSKVINIDALDAIKTYDFDILIISWPYTDNNAFECLKLAREKDKPILFIGDTLHTANKDFFESINIINPLEDLNKYLKSWVETNDNILFIK